MSSHALKLTLTQYGIEHEVICTADPSDDKRDCTTYAVGVYPHSIGECFIVGSARDLTLDELLGQFGERIELNPIPVDFHVERGERAGDEYATISPAAT